MDTIFTLFRVIEVFWPCSGLFAIDNDNPRITLHLLRNIYFVDILQLQFTQWNNHLKFRFVHSLKVFFLKVGGI